MPREESVTHWIGRLKEGDELAAQKIWEQYFEKLVRLARRKLQGTPRRAADEEDVALAAFQSFCAGVADGRFPRLEDRNDLWQLLLVITARKACAQRRHDRRLKRGGGVVRGESVFLGAGEPDDQRGIEQVIGNEPTPELAEQVVQECRELLDALGDETLRQVALWKMEGYSNDEIAEKLGIATRSVERKLKVIRSRWVDENPS